MGRTQSMNVNLDENLKLDLIGHSTPIIGTIEE